MKDISVAQLTQVSGGESTLWAILWSPGLMMGAKTSIVEAGPAMFWRFCTQYGKNLANAYWADPTEAVID